MRIALVGCAPSDPLVRTRALGFTPNHDIAVGQLRWLTVVSPDDPDGTELLLEPATTRPYRPSRLR